DFTGISEQLTPQALVKLINTYLSSMSRAIAIEDGVIDKFVGDTIMAYWGPPFVGEDEHALRAVRAGLDMFAILERFQRDIPEITGLRTGAPVIDIRIGIATGPVLIGSMGSDTVKNYTIMGDTVNVAARLESGCKYYGNRFLISESTRDLVGNAIVAREIDLVAVKGKGEPTRVFEPIGMAGNVDPDTERLLGVYKAGLRAYRQQEWAQAEDSFRTYLAKLDHDGPSKIYLDRIAVLKEKPPGPDWDGVWRMLSK
ncbi:MAG: adenylate/guanylate cyclase domain-containing protein, partial [Myxococcota bacterium]